MTGCCPQVASERGHHSDGNQFSGCRRIVSRDGRWRSGDVDIFSRRLALTPRWCKRAFRCRSAQMRVPYHGNTYLPWRARGPLRRPPSGHFFPSLRFSYPPQSSYIRGSRALLDSHNVRPFPGSPSGSSPSARVSPFIPQVWGTPDAPAST